MLYRTGLETASVGTFSLVRKHDNDKTFSEIERLMRRWKENLEKHAVPEFKAGHSNHTFSVNASSLEEWCPDCPTTWTTSSSSEGALARDCGHLVTYRMPLSPHLQARADFHSRSLFNQLTSTPPHLNLASGKPGPKADRQVQCGGRLLSWEANPAHRGYYSTADPKTKLRREACFQGGCAAPWLGLGTHQRILEASFYHLS